ncbi:two component transcriptional regulator, LytTR family [Selenomonas ruminantium]|uniref:Two component transcriptional regulator, LytTR family n=1 Tax=Selenomonas ruminantium TaxID=971 RepID=A0A1M6V8H2_SELRU|nr:LytTR family DNA-binding domain-containing protein [Selenomonas ruminantium]SHK77665.1 two component transcriptional regulator, LytTR family [Selenomonas ruminantium]
MKIAIVDDQMSDLLSAESHLLKYVRETHPGILGRLRIETFSSGEEFLESFEPGKFALILLDIYMGSMTGLETAEAIRLQDEKVPIMFLTTSAEHILEGYRVFAAGYFIKPLASNAAEFARSFEHVLPELLAQEKDISIPVAGENVDIPFRNIVYVDINDQHTLRLHLAESEVNTLLPYANCSEILLQDNRFLECHHRIILNMDYVSLMDKDEFILKDGSKIPISQRRKRDAKVSYMSYLAHR